MVTGLEKITVFAEFAIANLIFSFCTWRMLFGILDMNEINYTKKIKKSSFWFIFLGVIYFVAWGRFLQLWLLRFNNIFSST